MRARVVTAVGGAGNPRPLMVDLWTTGDFASFVIEAITLREVGAVATLLRAAFSDQGLSWPTDALRAKLLPWQHQDFPPEATLSLAAAVLIGQAPDMRARFGVLGHLRSDGGIQGPVPVG